MSSSNPRSSPVNLSLKKAGTQLRGSVEEGLKLHSCSFCDYSTHRKGDMTKHLRIHSGQKPFACSRCNWSFTQSSHLRMHMIRKHSQNDHPFKCLLCGDSFKTFTILSRHKKANHPIAKKPGPGRHAKKESSPVKSSLSLQEDLSSSMEMSASPQCTSVEGGLFNSEESQECFIVSDGSFTEISNNLDVDLPIKRMDSISEFDIEFLSPMLSDDLQTFSENDLQLSTSSSSPETPTEDIYLSSSSSPEFNDDINFPAYPSPELLYMNDLQLASFELPTTPCELW